MKAWEELLKTLEPLLGSESVAHWLRPLKVVHFDAANLHLEATPFQQAWFEEHARPLIKGAFFNNNGRPIRIHWEGALSAKKNPAASSFHLYPSPLDASFQMESFLSFNTEALALKITHLLVKGEEVGFNPIFLSGPKGSGKSHLLQGMAHALNQAKRKAFYVNAQLFTDHVVQAMRFGHMQDLRNHYRELDVLLIDDVHLFARRTATQEEFFHTFNTLHTLGKQIVLSANVLPSELQEIEQRLISRFEWGIALPLEPLTQDNLLQVLKAKAKILSLDLTAPMFAFLMKEFANPIEALHVLAIRSTRDLNLTSMQITLRDLLAKEQASKLTSDKILTQTAKHFSLTLNELTGKSQMREIAQPRQIAMYLCRHQLQMPFQAIGRLFTRDHSTVMTSVKQIAAQVSENGPLAESITLIEKALR